MMKKLSILILLIIMSLISKSQISMLDSNYVWANQWCCYFDSLNCGYNYNSVGGDTLYNSKIYKKVYGGLNNTGYTNYFLREDSGFVYNEHEEVYYNFHLQVGDTFTFPQSSMMPYLDVIVDSITTEFIFGQTRKVIKFDFLNMEWIEGIGSTTGLLYGDVWYWDCNQSLNCFYDGIDTYLGEGFDSCQIYNGTIGFNTITENLEIELYPNPVKDFLNINISPLKNKFTVNILNAVGVLVKQIDIINNSNNLEINVGDLNSGFYFVQLRFYDNTIVTRKIVIQ